MAQDEVDLQRSIIPFTMHCNAILLEDINLENFNSVLLTYEVEIFMIASLFERYFLTQKKKIHFNISDPALMKTNVIWITNFRSNLALMFQ